MEIAERIVLDRGEFSYRVVRDKDEWTYELVGVKYADSKLYPPISELLVEEGEYTFGERGVAEVEAVSRGFAWAKANGLKLRKS